MNLYEKEDTLYDIFSPYAILLFNPDPEGFMYKLSDEAPEEAIKASKEWRKISKNLEPIR
ncbi:MULTISPECIES: hypothetical protein [Aerococcus]|uniref:Uncharacterized protein n=2 Tax=Aerococcus TaxID=1375 RepID=A0A329NXA2_9LACT|nr:MULTISPECIES: hypothetical protein [Aerococcus]KAA9220466.1 hypothetical protein F6I39_01945 [Aerococcus loyolae]KAA9265598.1 hypothetical protein F6I19_04485 [Aerococcus loyolae]MCY3025666.1 hypothetical protein [Aerococcus loyolae]MCY3027314.1 hypothetical protein [Aerococcus loyolae]MCY3028935.1 hypothetical protein [Aerococcus loyolae]